MTRRLSDLIKKENLYDASLWGVVASNIISIVMALIQGWDLGEVMWVYWAQSVLIGLINFYRMLTLRDFSTEGFRSNGKPVPETQGAKRGVAFFFLFHYGFFHFVYAIFLTQRLSLFSLDHNTLFFLALCAAGFAGAHGFSLARNLTRDFKDRRPNLGTLMFYPYVRIVPMHLTIIFGAAVSGLAHGDMFVLVVFMLMKTVADAMMHLIEHSLFQDDGTGRIA